jgi:hypothetical protein
MIAEVEPKRKHSSPSEYRTDKREGFVGNFKSTLVIEGQGRKLEHGMAVMATGAAP